MALENILSQEIVQKLGWTLLHFIWQAAAVALLLGILLAVLRKSSANLRYIIACAALGLIVLLPIVTMQLVPVSVPQTTADIKPSPASVIVPVQPNEEALLARAIEYEEPTQLESVNSAPLASWKQRAVERLELTLPYIVSAWLLGVFGLSLWHLGGWAQLQRLRKKMIRQVDDSLCVKLRRLSERLRVKRAVQLVESALVQVPTVVGWLRPVILLPASALTGLTTEQLEALLAHELAHIRRCDYLVNILQTIVETLGFYHPAVWWISQRIRVERENCCDDLAVSISGDLVCYARALTSMEEIRAGRNKLAVAAASGDLFGRIRRLVAKESSNSNQAGWIPAVITIMLIAIIAIPTTLALTGQSENKNDSNIETLLINGFRENKDKFKCGVLVWNLTEKHEGLSEGPRTETKGTFQLWWDDKKITTKYTQERTDLDANIVTDKREGGNVYDGKILSRKPRFETYENWFGGQLINWTGPRSVDQEIPALMKRRNVEMDFSTVVVDGKELLKLLSKNIDKATADYGAYTLRYFDPSKNYGLVKDEWYTSDNRLRLRFSYEIKDVIPDGWFPVEVDVKGFSLKDSKVYLQRHLGLDLERCKFNDPSAIPEGIFDFSASKEHEQLNDILEKFSDGMTADKSDNNSKSVRESVEGYIAAALAGEDEKAAKYAYPDTTVAAQTKDMREALKGQNIRIVGACIGEWNSLAISSVIQADHGRIGSVVFHLKKVVLDQKVNWLIDDIDLETLDTIGKQISYFLNNVPDAKTIIISADMYANKQTEGQLKGEKGNIQPDKVVLNLVDPNSQPVAGAWVGTFVDWSDIAESPPIWFLNDGESYKASEIESAAKVISNEEGEITLTEEELFKPQWPTERTVPLTAIDEGHYLAGLREISREDLGKEVTLTLQPACRVHGRLNAAAARKRKWSMKTLTVYVDWDVHRPCQYSSEQGRFEFVLPPGKYNVKVYSEDPDKAITMPILIRPGQRDLDLTNYLDGTNTPPAVQTDIMADAEDSVDVAKKTRIVKVDLSVVEVPPDSKMDRETTVLIKNLLAGKITVPDSPAVADLLRKAAGATAAVEDESAGDKRVTQEQFKTLFDILVSRGFVKILMRPTLEVVDGHTAKITGTQDSIQITPHVSKDSNIILLQIEAALSSQTIPEDDEQTPIVNRHEIATLIRLSPGESGIISGMKHAGLITETGKDAKDSKTPATEMLVILTPTIVETAGNQQNEEMVTRVYDISDLVGATISRGTVDGMMDGSGDMIGGSGGMGSSVKIPDQAIVNEARNIANLIMQTIAPNSWYENDPNAKGIITPFPAARPRKLAINQSLPAHQQIQKFLESRREQTDTTQISIGLRYLYTNVEFLDEVRDSMDIEFKSDTFLDDKQLETLLRASQKKREIRSLMAPGVTVLNNETARFNTARHIFMSFLDYSKPNNVSQQSTPVPVDTFCSITPHIEDNKNIIIDFVQDIPGLQERIIYDRREMVQSYTETIAITNKRIPNNKTFAFTCDIIKFDQDNQTASPAEKKTLIVLIKPTIIAPEEMPRSEAAAMILNSLRSKGYTAEQTDETIFLKPVTEEQPGIDKAQIMIETRIMTVSDTFLKDIGLDANSISDANAISDPNAWPEPAPVVLAPPDNLGTYRLILDDLQVAFLLKAIRAHKDAQILTSPRVTVLDGEKAEMFIGQETDFVSGYSEPNRPSDKPTPRIEKLKTGTSICLKPQLTPDKKNLYLDFESEIRELRGIEERKYKGKYPYQIPQVTVVNTKTSCLIPDGKTLLNCGQKITQEVESVSRVPMLGDIPILGGLFRSNTKTTEPRTLLILVKPSIDPQIKAPPEPQPLDPNDPLINPPEEKLNRADEQK